MRARSSAAAKRQGFDLRYHPLERPQGIDAVFAAVTSWRAQDLLALGSPVFVARQRVAEFALQQRLPSCSETPVQKLVVAPVGAAQGYRSPRTIHGLA